MPNPVSNRSSSNTETAIPVRIPPSATTHAETPPVVARDAYSPAGPANPFAADSSSAITSSARNAARLNAARQAIIANFRDEFINSPEFQSSMGPKTWSDVRADVENDARTFGTGSDSDVYNDANGNTTFTGRIYGLYTEARVNAQGKADKIYFEID